jgi:rhodanese-related sulfurtransferase
MQTPTIRPPDPERARAYFEDKITFTTGPVELDHLLKSAEPQLRVVDVREAEDYAQGHIPGAINLPRGTWGKAEGLSRDKANIVYCYSQVCHLAANACVVFARQGFPAMEMEGGFAAWKERDLDIEREPENRMKSGTAQRRA